MTRIARRIQQLRGAAIVFLFVFLATRVTRSGSFGPIVHDGRRRQGQSYPSFTTTSVSLSWQPSATGSREGPLLARRGGVESEPNRYRSLLSSSWNRIHSSSTRSAAATFSSTRLYATSSSLSSSKSQQRDVVIVGGGLAGLSAALYVTQLDPTRHVTILEREEHDTPSKAKTAVGSWAAAGMLAPQSERLPQGSLLDLCLQSRQMFPDFVDLVESYAQMAGSEGQLYISESEESTANNNNGNNNKSQLQPWSVGYVASGGFLAPAFAGDSVATWAPPEQSGSAQWLDAFQVRELEPHLHPDVIGGWWFPEDASVDARRLTCSLRAACVAAGVQLLCGSEYEISSLDLSDTNCRGVYLQSGRYMAANVVLVANGAWMRNLLPVPIVPHKGQSLSLRMPSNQPPLLRRVLFAQDSYIVPKADGRIVIGATVEAGNYDSHVTPAGLLHIISHALQLVPGLKELPIEETWAGLRPTTPDKGPILGKTLWKNLYVAGGYWRNGVLLAPKTGHLMASLITGQQLDEQDQRLLHAFAWDRFTSPGQGISLAAQSRYAASIHPIHSRRTGAGVAASVGTELGTYSSARSASEERQRDRSLLMQGLDLGNNQSDEEAFERAASLGKLDSVAYEFGDKKKSGNTDSEDAPIQRQEQQSFPNSPYMASLQVTEPYEGSADALTVGSSDAAELSENAVDTSSNKNESTTKSLQEVYAAIRANKAQRTEKVSENNQEDDDVRPDPGFRIYHVDKEGQTHEVPPYTTPGEFHASLRIKRSAQSDKDTSSVSSSTTVQSSGDVVSSGSSDVASVESVTANSPLSASSSYSEQTYDGYQDIQQANARATRQEELQAMRIARQKNRQGQSSIDPNQIGAQRMDHLPTVTASTSSSTLVNGDSDHNLSKQA